MTTTPQTATTAADEAGVLARVYVTGGASGLGAAVVQAVRKHGGQAYVLDLEAPQEDVEHELVDLSDTGDAARAVAALAERVGPPTAVVTAAGTDACGPLETVPVETWERVVKVNLLGTAAVVRAALPHLLACHGGVVTVASTLGLKAVGDATAYCASKFGVVGFTRALATELAGRVGVTLLVPGGMSTRFFDGRPDQYKPGPDAVLNDPGVVADLVVTALTQPRGSQLRELVACTETEPSWP
ncbi:SDR family oxidoreductase [Thalassiella azotivora]